MHGRLGYCPQSVVLDGVLTPDQHLRYFQAAYHIGSLRRAEDLLDRLGYARYRGQPAATLSGGTRQKLNLTLALMHDPAVLLLDEPCQGFDRDTYLAFWNLTPELTAAGTAIVASPTWPSSRNGSTRSSAWTAADQARSHRPCASSLRPPWPSAWPARPATGSPPSCRRAGP